MGPKWGQNISKNIAGISPEVAQSLSLLFLEYLKPKVVELV